MTNGSDNGSSVRGLAAGYVSYVCGGDGCDADQAYIRKVTNAQTLSRQDAIVFSAMMAAAAADAIRDTVRTGFRLIMRPEGVPSDEAFAAIDRLRISTESHAAMIRLVVALVSEHQRISPIDAFELYEMYMASRSHGDTLNPNSEPLATPNRGEVN